jgi:predicted protein tyrosine phosphatase
MLFTSVETPVVTISGQFWARRHKRDFDAVLTIEDPLERWGVRFHLPTRPAHLILQFLDLDEPLPSDDPKYRLADLADVEAGLVFARDRQRLLVHCRAGISRSTAMTLGILTERLGDPAAAFAEVLRLQPHAVPNRHIVRLLDHVLNLDGTLDTMIQAWEKPAHQRLRALNRRAISANVLTAYRSLRSHPTRQTRPQ